MNKLERQLGVRPVIAVYDTAAVSLFILSVTVSHLRFLIKRVADVSKLLLEETTLAARSCSLDAISALKNTYTSYKKLQFYP